MLNVVSPSRYEICLGSATSSTVSAGFAAFYLRSPAISGLATSLVARLLSHQVILSAVQPSKWLRCQFCRRFHPILANLIVDLLDIAITILKDPLFATTKLGMKITFMSENFD